MTDQNNSSIANSSDPAADRRQQLAALIPEAFSEGQLDVAALKRRARSSSSTACSLTRTRSSLTSICSAAMRA